MVEFDGPQHYTDNRNVIVDLYKERTPIYKLNADYFLDCGLFNQCLDYKAVVDNIVSFFKQKSNGKN